jgi:hypothetical protein
LAIFDFTVLDRYEKFEALPRVKIEVAAAWRRAGLPAHAGAYSASKPGRAALNFDVGRLRARRVFDPKFVSRYCSVR